MWGSAPHPGIYRFTANGMKKTKAVTANRTAHATGTLRRSGRFPAEPYPPKYDESITVRMQDGKMANRS